MSSSSQRSREIDDDDQRKDYKEGIDQNAASGTADSIVLEEDLDPNYIPESTEILEYARWLGLDPEKDEDLMWVAREGLLAPLPDEWKPCRTKETGELYYFNFSSGESAWDHPCDGYYKRLFEEEKRKKETRLKDLGDSRKNAAKQEVGKLTGRRQRDKKKRRPERSPSTSIDSTAGVVTSTTTTNANTVTRETVSKANILPNLARTPLPRISTAIASEISQQPSPRTLRMKLSPSSVNIDSSKPSRFFAEEKAEVVKEEATENQSSKSAIYFDMNYLSEDKIKSDVHIPTKIKLTEIAAVSKINDDLMIRPTPSLSPANSSREMNILIGKYEAQIESLQHHRDIDRRMIDALQTELALSKQTADRTERALNQQVSDERRQQQSLRTEFESQLRDIERVRSALQSKLQLAEADVIRYKSEGSQLQQQHQLEIDATRQSEERYNSLLAIGNSIHIASAPTTVPLVDYQSLKDTLQQQEQEHRTELQALARERASWRAKHQSLSAEYERAEELNEELRIQIQKLLTARPISINNSTDNNHNNHNSGVRDPASTEPIESNINSTERDKIRERERQSLQIDFEVQLFLASSEVKTMAVRIADLEQQLKEARQACEHTLRERNAIEQDHMKIEQEYTDKLDIANKHITQLEQNRDNIQHSYQTNLQTLKDHHVDTIRQLDSSVTQWQIKYQQMHQKYNSMLQEYTEYRNTVQTRLSDSMMTHVGVQTYTPVPVAMISVGTETDSDMLPTVAPAESLPINQPIAESSCVGVVRSHHRYSSSKIEEIVPDDTNEDNLDDGVDVEGDEDDGFESLHLQSLGQHRSLARSASTTTLMKPATRKQHSHKLTTEAISTKKTGQSKSQMDYIEEQDEDVFSLASSTHSSNYGEGDDYSGSSNTSSGNEFLSSANTDDPVNRSIEEHMVEEIAELMATRAQLKHAKQTLKEQTQALKKEKYKWKDHKSGKRAVSKSDALALARDWNQRTEALNESMQQINETTDRVRHREKVLRVALGAFADDTHTDWLLYTPYSTPSQHLGKSVNSTESSSIPHHTRSTRQYLATSQELETDEDDVNARNHMTATSSLLKQALQLQLKSHASPNRYRENSRNQSELPSSQSEPHVLMPVRLLHAARSGSPFVDTSAAYIYTHPHPHHTGTSVTNGSAAANHNTHIESHLNRVDPTSLHQRSRRLREEVNSFAEKQEASSRIFDEHSRWLSDLDKRLETFRC